ncbi:MAG: hypothetical protein M1828_001641 [Chrysothrix sp. TS-e1954]|nr:MAG: hypothetical protein M1828_001641 [Chrysothrix sp. TS-e1954]
MPRRSHLSSGSRRRSVASRATQTQRPQSFAKALEKPKPPRELFTDDFVAKVAGQGITSTTDLSEERLEREWTQLGKEGQQYWEAQFGRDVLGIVQQAKVAQPPTPTLKDGDDAVGDMSYDFDGLDMDADRIKASLRDFHPTSRIELDDRKPSTNNEERLSCTSDTPDPKVPNILYRGEVYKLRHDPYTRRRRSLRATLEDTFESKLPLLLNLEPELEHKQDDLPIFEITQYLAAPPEEPKQYYPSHVSLSTSSDEEAKIPAKPPIKPPKTGISAQMEAGTVMTINSSSIIDAIHAVAPDYPELVMEGDSIVLPEPFCLLLQYRNQMLAHRKMLSVSSHDESSVSHERTVPVPGDDEFSASADHITQLYQFLDGRYMNAVVEEHQRWKQCPPVCTFEWLWLLFRPRTLVYRRNNANDPILKAYLVKHFRLHGLFNNEDEDERPTIAPERLASREGSKFKHHLDKITLILTYLKHDGRAWKQREKKCTIRPFKGARVITELPVFPMTFLDDPEGVVRSKLITRGQRYHSLAIRGQFDYHGAALSGTRRTVHGRIMVDVETFHHDKKLAGRDILSYEESLSSGTPYRRVGIPYRREGKRPRHVAPPPVVIPEVNRYDTDSESQSEISVADEVSLDANANFGSVVSGEEQSMNDTEVSAKKASLSSLELGSLSSATVLSDDLYMVCSGTIMAYVINENQWVLLDLDSIRDCNYDQQMIDDLQVPDQAKRLLLALSQTYALKSKSHGDDINTVMTGYVSKKRDYSQRQPPQSDYRVESGPILNRTASFPPRWSSDFVPNKGQGQIILLHGKPGVGKTSSAECLSELTKRPLLTVTCGNLGTDARSVNEELSRWLRLGDLWNAILLFDEADVFLESREKGDLKRNTLVSVFLRALEYYQGLIFLTTNRVGVFDEAIMSRIHVVLHFPDLTHTDRERIWDTSFRKLDAERPDVAVDLSLRDYVYRDEGFKALNWNGREIRNAFNTMLALAEWDAREYNRFDRQGRVEIRKDHLQQVAKMSSSFKDYLKSLRGIDEAKYAKFRMVRNDVFTEKG